MNKSSFENSQARKFNEFFEHMEFDDNAALQIEFKMLLDFIGDVQDKRVLDLGCGVGRNGLRLAQYAKEVVGYDISEVGVAKANESAASLGVTNFRAELNDFSDIQEESFDVILCVNMLHHAHDPSLILRSVYRALRPGGSLIVMENNPLNPLFPIFFILIGQLRAHLTRQYFMVNRFTLSKIIRMAGLSMNRIQRYGFFPTSLYNISSIFKSINEWLNKIPVLQEVAAYYLIRADKQ